MEVAVNFEELLIIVVWPSLLRDNTSPEEPINRSDNTTDTTAHQSTGVGVCLDIFLLVKFLFRAVLKPPIVLYKNILKSVLPAHPL
jgi:hypothetical protein